MRLPVIVMLAACVVAVAAASGQTAPKPAQASKTNAPTNATKPVAPAASSPAAPRQETLEEIVARVQRRLALEVPRKPRPAAPRLPVVERVKLVWRPAVVWPSELSAPEPPPSAPAVNPTPAAPNQP